MSSVASGGNGCAVGGVYSSIHLCPSATAARCVQRWSGMNELDHKRSPFGCVASVVETKNSTPLVSGSRKSEGVRSSSLDPAKNDALEMEEEWGVTYG